MRLSSFLLAALPIVMTLIESKVVYVVETSYVTVTVHNGPIYTPYEIINENNNPIVPEVVVEVVTHTVNPQPPASPDSNLEHIPEVAPEPIVQFTTVPVPIPQREEANAVVEKVITVTSRVAAETKAPEPNPEPNPQKEDTSLIGSSLSSVSEECLSAHNAKRSRHGVGALKWSSQLESFSSSVASSYDCSGRLIHTGGPYGENLALGYRTTTDAINAWYNEGSYGQFNHFTQVIWKDTTELACSVKDCNANGWGLYVICVYSNPGNVIGQWSQNVLPLIG